MTEENYPKIEEYLLEQIDGEKYYYEYEDLSTSINVREALKHIIKNTNCTCKKCSLNPQSLCLNRLMAWKVFTSNLVFAGFEWKKKINDMKQKEKEQ